MKRGRKITRATDAEKRAYAEKRPVYPLYGFVTLRTGERLPVEDVRGSWSEPDPVYEVMAPLGFRFQRYDTHSLLYHSIADIRTRCTGILEKCDDTCGHEYD